ncbi:alpha/beta hydrolase [Patulibacter defluvii]|uniref:alpha/beta hydrolase n=1 Tax=Patulibacter defluvii TaxID=3095358 RepID=UPI002A74B970|nr:alpha/beta hydrolase [Patulibacter sp. DM4]
MDSGPAVGPVVRQLGPPSPAALVFERRLRRILRPLAAGWRMTPRGVLLLQRISEPRGRRIRAKQGTLVEETTIDGVPVERVWGPRAQQRRGPDQAVLLYLHGGGYVFGSPRTHRVLTSQLSHASGIPAVVPDYRLPPVATLPAPVEDALAVYRALLRDHDPARIVVAGDSAGGNLAHALLLHAAEAGLPMPAGLVLLSPWSDLSMSGPSVREHDGIDPFIPEVALWRCARVACAGLDPADWRCSPLFGPAELQAQLPPTLLQVGSTELLRDDSRRVAQRLADAGVRAELEIYERVPHVPPIWGNLPEGRDATERIGRFLAAVLPDGAAHRPTPAEAAAAVADETTTEDTAETAAPTDPLVS